MRIGILTGGGDVPGLNPCIKAVVNRVHEEGHQVTGIRRGWGGLLGTNPEDPESLAANLVELDPTVVRTVDRSGGTFLHSSRTNPGKVRTKDVPDFLADQVNFSSELANQILTVTHIDLVQQQKWDRGPHVHR